ncbi:MAG TPA: ABC transporter permease [Vicinamibacterales bacterium]|nr:ABC transporter permease [Vicinamibacterales bacterium]
MGALRSLLARLRAIARRDAIAGEIHDELRFHVDSRVEQYEREGLTRDEATRKARDRVGNVALHQDRGYEVRGGGVMETIWQDVRYSVRLLARQRGFSLVAILTLALGIGASTAIFTVVDAAMLNPLPYPHPEQLVRIGIEFARRDGQIGRMAPSYNDMLRWQPTGIFSAQAMWKDIYPEPVLEGDQPERVSAGGATADYLSVFGVAPIAGRAFNNDDMAPGAPPVVLLSYPFWQSRFGGDRSVIGQPLRFDSGSATIVGILPNHFETDTSIWRPLRVEQLDQRGSGGVVVARLATGGSNEQASQRMTALTTMPVGPGGRAPNAAVRAESMLEFTRAGYRTTVNILAGAVGVVLLIACVNVAGLLLARGTTRQAELAVRASIGAGRGRLTRQLLTESIVLALSAGVIGVVVAWLSLDALVANIPLALPVDAPAKLNLRVLGAAVALTVFTGLVFGLVPALRLSRTSLGPTLARGNRRQGSTLTRRGGQLLIAAEIALAVVLVAGAGLMVRSFARVMSIDLGFEPGAIVTMRATPLSDDPATHAQYYPQLLDALRRVPGVRAAGAIDNVPLGGSLSFASFIVDGNSSGLGVERYLPGYFQTIALPATEGQLPTEADLASGRNLIVVSAGAARTLFADGSAVGRQVQLETGPDKGVWEVAAVVPNVRHDGALFDTPPQVYLPFRPVAPMSARSKSMIIVLRTSHSIPGLADTMRQAAFGVGPRVLVEQIRSGDELLARDLLRPRQRTVLLALLGGLGLVLALVGVFGMTAYAVARRTQEIGVRMAFGARAGQVVLAMVRDSAWPIVLGTIAGLGAAALATRVIASFLFNTTPTDPGTFAVVAITLAVAGCLAAWIPARRAARVDPVTALRVE